MLISNETKEKDVSFFPAVCKRLLSIGGKQMSTFTATACRTPSNICEKDRQKVCVLTGGVDYQGQASQTKIQPCLEIYKGSLAL